MPRLLRCPLALSDGMHSCWNVAHHVAIDLFPSAPLSLADRVTTLSVVCPLTSHLSKRLQAERDRLNKVQGHCCPSLLPTIILILRQTSAAISDLGGPRALQPTLMTA